jgi:hypothetical protein
MQIQDDGPDAQDDDLDPHHHHQDPGRELAGRQTGELNTLIGLISTGLDIHY